MIKKIILHVEDFIALYKQDSWVAALSKKLQDALPSCFHLQGLTGSLDAVLVAAIAQLTSQMQLFILPDQEEAAHFYSDLRHLCSQKTILWYPASPKPLYETQGIDHADVLLRTAILHQVSYDRDEARLLVTYPEALTERVIQQEALVKSTSTIQLADPLLIETFVAGLMQQGFKKTDFVYEVGQFAVRGGIIDIFSYAHQLPYRIELRGNTVVSIRTFDPTNQQSVKQWQQAAILPHINGPHHTLGLQSLLDFLPATTLVWLKDHAQVLHTIATTYQKAMAAFQQLVATSEQPPSVKPPEEWLETPASWMQSLQRLTKLEFGARFYLPPTEVCSYQAEEQPVFNQNFALLAENLSQNQEKGVKNILTATAAGQFERLTTIFSELAMPVTFQTLQLGLHRGYVDHHLGIACYTDHQLFDRYYRYQVPPKYAKTKAITLRELQTLQLGDYVVHIDYGIGRFAGLSKIVSNGKQQEAIRLLYKDDDLVYVSLHALHKISKYAGKEGAVPAISKLGTSAWEHKKKHVKRKVKDIAKELIQLYAKRKQAIGFAFSQDSLLQAELAASFMYEETPDQVTVMAAITNDMESPHPMDRLVCGDVGFGKTEVAIRAAFKAINDGKQVAVLVPTTILALQHYNSFRSRLANFPVQVNYINRFKTAQEIKQVLQETATGKVGILIGTHRILNKGVRFKDLGLLIVDEEQKFGVTAKDRIKNMKVNVDVLTLTATPIPRTLQFSLMGARDLSIIATPPANRQPVVTAIHSFNQAIIRDAIQYEVQRGGQVFFVHNRVANIEAIAHMLYKLVPECRIGVAHGQLEGKKLEQRLIQFMEGAYDVLVTTSIIESGLDIPNANTILIHDSHLFGLSDLHQIRGRVGRSNTKAFCYLLVPAMSTLTAEARRRLSALEAFSELGDGFKVAMRDLDIRGAGDLLGAAQSGFIAEVGFDTYCKILEDAVKELKEGEFKALFEEGPKVKAMIADCILETDLEILIPDTYVSNVTERLNLYTRLDHIQDEASLRAFQEELKDRFGPLPSPITALIQAVKLRWTAKKLGLQKIKLKDNTLQCYITPNASPLHVQGWERILAYVHQYPHRCRLQEQKAQLRLLIDAVTSINQAQVVLAAIGACSRGFLQKA